MEQAQRRFLLIETSVGSRICVSLQDDGKVMWHRPSIVCERSRIIKSVKSHGACVRIRNLQSKIAETVQDQALPLSTDSIYSIIVEQYFTCSPSQQRENQTMLPKTGVPASTPTNCNLIQTPCISRWVNFGDDVQIVNNFQEDGFVVVRDVFGEDELERARKELWESPNLLGRDSNVRRDDPTTWGREHWPQDDGGKNFLGSIDPFLDRACWEFAQNPRALNVMKLLWRQHGVDEVLLAGSPRWGVMRPTAINSSWRTLENWLHWDQNPWTEPDFGRIQAIACISEQTASSGGLLCVPGFQKRWTQWGRDHAEGTVVVDGKTMTREFGAGNPFLVPKDDPSQQQVVRILAPAGSLVLWDSRLPHQNYPNSGTDFRIVLYLNFLPWSDRLVSEKRDAMRRKLFVMRALGANSDAFWPNSLTSLGRAISGTPEVSDIADIDLHLSADPNLLVAIKLCDESAKDEQNGNLDGHVAKLRKAEKLFPEIADWYDVLFA